MFEVEILAPIITAILVLLGAVWKYIAWQWNLGKAITNHLSHHEKELAPKVTAMSEDIVDIKENVAYIKGKVDRNLTR